MPRPPRLLAPAAVAMAAAGACAFVALANPTIPGGITPLCPSKWLFGITCPGCGSARMIYCLLHGDLLRALHFNALGMVALVLLAWSYLAWALSRVRGITLPRWERWRWSPMTVLVVVLGWLVVRNLPFPPFDSLRV